MTCHSPLVGRDPYADEVAAPHGGGVPVAKHHVDPAVALVGGVEPEAVAAVELFACLRIMAVQWDAVAELVLQHRALKRADDLRLSGRGGRVVVAGEEKSVSAIDLEAFRTKWARAA